ncbi:unnamed protein product [Sphagnum compactum]
MLGGHQQLGGRRQERYIRCPGARCRVCHILWLKKMKGEEADTEAHHAVAALVEESPLLLPTPLSLVTDATSAAAVVPRLPFLLQTKMVSEGGSPDASSVFSNIPPRPNRVGKPASSSKYSELHWEGHFDEEKQIAIPDSVNTFHVYLAGSQGPVLFCLHGGGYTGLSFALVAGKMREKVRIICWLLYIRMNVSKLIRIHLEVLTCYTQCQDVLDVIKEMYGHETPAMILVGHSYVWRTCLEHSEAYWRGWYEGLSEGFLSCPVPKLLLLAGTDRLDRNLTIGQMQGKFQMIVVRNTGHAIQEDVPDEFANVMLNFVSRNRIGAHGVEIPGLQQPITLRSAN